MLSAFALAPLGAATGPQPGNLPNSPATDLDETFFADQWSLRQINGDDAHALTGGSPLVRVALIDTGIDPGHPEFAGRIDASTSVSCASGEPDQDPDSWRDQVGHGTQMAGIVAAGDNGFGIIGVAPHVTLVIVKVANAGQPITPAAAACAFNWVARDEVDVDVATASFTIDKGPTAGGDPLDFFCRNVAAEKSQIKLVKKAVREARRAGVTVVAAIGNGNLDLAHPPAPFTNRCIRMPVELPGVTGVTSDGRFGQRATNPPSNYGVGIADVVAPGGDVNQGGNPGGLVLSTWPSYIVPPSPPFPPNIVDPVGPGGSTYRYTAGTSAATAHATGVAALIVSRFGNVETTENGKLRPGQVEAFLEQSAEDLGAPGYDEFFGHGEVDALGAVLHDPAP